MKSTSYRYKLTAVGKGGQMYLTRFEDKQELKQWLAENESKLVMDKLKITDEKKQPFVKFLSLFRLY